MTSRTVRELKVALALVTVAYAGLKYLKYQRKERKKLSRKSLKRKHETTSSSSSSSSSSTSEDEDYEPPRKLKLTPAQVKLEKDIDDSQSQDQNSSLVRNPDENKASSDFFDFEKEYSEETFKEIFHVCKNTSSRLYTQFQYSLEYENIFKLNDVTKIPAKDYIWMFLWFVTRKCSLLDLAKEFETSLTKTVSIVDTVLQFLNSLSKDLIRFPETESELVDSAKNFQLIAGIPDVIACLTSTQLENKGTKTPYWFQAFSDSRGRILDVFVDSSCNLHPTEVLENSQISKKFKTILPSNYHALANQDYFMRPWLLTPIDKVSNKTHIQYNRKHSVIMNAALDRMDNLFQRFPQLTCMEFFSKNKVKRVITACCVLQNICLEEEDYFEAVVNARSAEKGYRGRFQQKPKPVDSDAVSLKHAEMKRTSIIVKL